MSIDKIIAELPARMRATETVMNVWCRKVIDRSPRANSGVWAIVGGAIRDSLFGEPYQTFLPFIGTDVDFAVSDGSFRDLLSPTNEGRVVRRNTFGGWKVIDDDLGTLDIWHADLSSQHTQQYEAWTYYLNQLDFSLNAVAYIWPEKHILLHPSWQDDLRNRRIRRLEPVDLPRTLGPIRAIALASRMRELTNKSFHLDQRNAADFRWLTHVAQSTDIQSSLCYLGDKLRSQRWPVLILKRLEIELTRKPPGSEFRIAFQELKQQLRHERILIGEPV